MDYRDERAFDYYDCRAYGTIADSLAHSRLFRRELFRVAPFETFRERSIRISTIEIQR